ncbi:hypothetical protein QFC19_001780 [Naganishia cerealis]|uniref:Uncharacterized protein n=1 Tax=Naganishia cerealis TaxID=610337 RepID=A0ACC2WEA8_9TREE|nr:hypothetical protein QFC19_001780 [Naganishia cerealis]
MDNDGFTIVKRSHKSRASRPPPGGHSKGKSVPRLAYDTREQGKSTQTTATMEEKLEKLLAILQTRRRQLLEDEQGSGKGKTFLKRWEVCASPESQVNEGEKQEVAAQRRAGGVVLLANDFRGYIENAPRSQIENELPSVYRLTPHLSRIPFPSLSSSHIASNAFNSLVFQYLGSQAAKEVDWFTTPPVGCDRDSATETEVIVGEIKGELERMKISPPRKEELAALNDGAGSSEEHDGYTGQDALRDEFRNETEG